VEPHDKSQVGKIDKVTGSEQKGRAPKVRMDIEFDTAK
jgi:hypothetical protein